MRFELSEVERWYRIVWHLSYMTKNKDKATKCIIPTPLTHIPIYPTIRLDFGTDSGRKEGKVR